MEHAVARHYHAHDPRFINKQQKRRLLSELKRCSLVRDLELGRKSYFKAIQLGFLSDEFVVSSLINMYSKCGRMSEARKVFDTAVHTNVVCWTALINGYVENQESQLGLEIFNRFELEQVGVADGKIYLACLCACSSLVETTHSSRYLEQGNAVYHRALMENSCDIFVDTAAIRFYSSSGCMVVARSIFDKLPEKNVVAWNVLLRGYVENGENELVLQLFHLVLERNPRTFVAAISACAAMVGSDAPISDLVDTGKELHARALRDGFSNLHVDTTLVSMYSRMGRVFDAAVVLDNMPERDPVAWTALALGLINNGENELSLKLIHKMIRDFGWISRESYAAALMACSNLKALETGKEFHRQLMKKGLDRELLVANSLLDFYSKCGEMSSAKKCFDALGDGASLVSWNTLMHGYAIQGNARSVLELFRGLKQAGFMPDEATFVSLLMACAHSGMAEAGKECFEVMKRSYGVKVGLQHYNCLVDLLSRSSCVEEAFRLVKTMPFEADFVTWTSVNCNSKN